MDDDETRRPIRRPVGPRLYHKKSRMGCSRCKARRVKCDEKRPTCGGCSRHQVECSYPAQPKTSQNAFMNVQPLRPAQPVNPSSSADAGLWASDYDASLSSDNRPHSPIPSTAFVSSQVDDGSAVSAPPHDPSYLSILPKPVDFSALSIGQSSGLSPQPTRVESLSPNSFWAPDASSVHPATDSTREPSVASNDSSSNSKGCMVREATDYLSHLTDPEILDLPESKERRMWELRLMHNYMLCQTRQFNSPETLARHGAQPLAGTALDDSDLDPDNPNSRNGFGGFVWGREITQLAFENNSIMCSVLAASALEMWTRSTDQKERDYLRLLQQKYLSIALREQREAVGSLSRENADDICIAALNILHNAFTLVQTLPVSPWQPPLEWLRMGKGAGAVLVVAKGFLGFRKGGDRITRFTNSSPRLEPDDIFRPENRAHLNWLLENDGNSENNVGDHELVGNSITLGIYNKVLSYIGRLQTVMTTQQPLYIMLRWFNGFAIWIPELYHDFVAQRRPRALITLAHFFKLWIPYDTQWQVGKTGENQVRAIYDELPPEWKHKVAPIFEEYNLGPPAQPDPMQDENP